VPTATATIAPTAGTPESSHARPPRHSPTVAPMITARQTNPPRHTNAGTVTIGPLWDSDGPERCQISGNAFGRNSSVATTLIAAVATRYVHASHGDCPPTAINAVRISGVNPEAYTPDSW
jgi:hypothetical protein